MITMRFDLMFHGPFRVAIGRATTRHDIAGDHDEPIPASSLKGVSRHAALSLLGLPQSVVDAMFGSASVPSSWSWSAAQFSEPPRVQTRARVAIDDRTGTATEGALVLGEDMWAPRAQFTLHHLGTATPSSDELLGLIAAVTSVQSLGGDRRRGMGWVTIRLAGVDGDTGALDPAATDLPDRAADAVMRLRVAPDRAADRAPQVRIRSTRVENTAQHAPSNAVLTLRIDACTTGFVSAGDGPQVGNHRAASIAIPGSTVRGAMASLWLRDHPGRAGEDPVFQELFDSTVRWPALDPMGSAVIPLSVRRCKYRPDSGCRDVLVDSAFSIDGEHAGFAQHCHVCGGPLELSKGELESFAGVAQVRPLTRTSVQLDEDETAAHGALFSRDGIAADGRLSGRAPITTPLISDEARAWLRGLVGRMVRVGGRRSVAGGLEITGAEIDTTIAGAVAAGTRLAMRAAQPVILLDAFGAPSTDPVEFIARTHLTGLRPIDTGTFLRTAPHGGWNGLAGLPKSVDTALVMGSTLVVETDRELSADEVAGLLRRGIGPRASEGFGALSIDSAHWEPPVAHEHTGGDQR